MDDRGEITDYVLGELDELELARFERRLQEDAGLRAEVVRLSALVGRLDGLSEDAWNHVSAHHAGEPAPAARPLPAIRSRSRRRPAGLALAAAAAAAVALVLALGSHTSTGRSHTVVLSALAGAPKGARAIATIEGAARVQVTVEHLPPTGSSRYYEVWLMTDTTHLVAVGSFRVGSTGRTHLSMALPASPASYRYLNVSLQRAGGGSAISNVSLLRGRTQEQ
jgi:anti-sigma-K factor RskA